MLRPGLLGNYITNTATVPLCCVSISAVKKYFHQFRLSTGKLIDTQDTDLKQLIAAEYLSPMIHPDVRWTGTTTIVLISSVPGVLTIL